MTTTYEVRFWEIRVLKSGKRRYGVRWMTAAEPHSRYFVSRAQADNRRSELMQAARKGEEFDVESGLPVSELKTYNSPSFLCFAQSYVDLKWRDSAAKTRISTVEALATVGSSYVQDAPGRPSVKELRHALMAHLLPPNTRGCEDIDIEDKRVSHWLQVHSRTLDGFHEASTVREVLNSIATNLNGQTAAATVYRRKRAVLFNFLSYAVEKEHLDENPLPKIKRPAPKLGGEVDPGVVANPGQVDELLTAVTYVGRRNQDRGAHLYAFFATCYYAAARPAEGLALREDDCKLPEDGWGELALGESRPSAGKRWTDSGEVHDRRGLKHRAAKERRFVPIPPVLVRILRAHIERFGVGPDGRLFRSPNGGMVGSGSYSRVWEAARAYGLLPGQVASRLAGRPYDLRHAAVSLWLNGGVSPTEVATRAGQSVEVLLRVYAKCIYGQRDEINKRIDGLYGDDKGVA